MCQQRIRRILFRKGRNFQRMSCNHSRLNKVFLNIVFKASINNFADSIVFPVFNMEFIGNFTSFFDSLNLGEVFSRVFFHRFNHGHAIPRSRQLYFFINVRNFRRAVQFKSQFRHEFFRNANNIFQITEGLVQFNSSKFRIMSCVNPFIAEAAVHFINTF